MAKQLPHQPNLDHLRKQAKDLKRSEPGITLATAQHRIANEYGFDSWPKLVHHIEELTLKALNRDQLLARFKAARSHRRPLHEARTLLQADPSLPQADLLAACVGIDPEAIQKHLPDTEVKDEHLIELLFSPLAKVDPNTTLACARLLLEAGANPNAALKDSEPLSVLYAAVSLPSLDLVKELLARGADPNDNESLYHSCENDGIEFTRVLLDNGARIPGSNSLNRTSDWEKPDGIRLLLERGGDPNADGTLAHAINRGRSVEYLKILLEFGANPDRSSIHGVSARQLAYQRGYPLDLFPGDFNPTETDKIVRKAYLGEPQSESASVASISHAASWALSHAASNNEVAIVRSLLEAGLKDSPVGYSKETALHQAAWAGCSDVIRVLVEFGGDLGFPDRSYHAIPIQWAMFSSQTANHNRHPDAVRTMIELGSPPPVALFGSDEVVEVLLDAFPDLEQKE